MTYKLDDLKTKVIHIGKVAENDATRVQIDAGSVFAEHPAAVPTMSMINPDGTAFPVSVERSGDLVLWDVKDSALAAEGPGEIQFTFTEENTVVKGPVGRVQICRSIVGDGEAPDPIQDWMTEADAALDEIEGISATAETLSAGSQATASYDSGVLTFGIPQGAPGQDGQDGADGQDGVSPTVAVTEITGGHTVTITDAEGDHAFNVMDGTAGAVIDDTSTAADKVWSASKTNELKSKIAQKPEVHHDSALDADLDVTDEEGYVIARFANGNVQTKNFDSSSVPAIRSTTAHSIPLDVIDEEGYVILRLVDGHIQTKNFDSSTISVGFEYKFSGDDLLIGYGYSETSDAVVVLNCGRANGLFDFAGLKTKPKGVSLKNLETADLTTVWNSGTDMHGPFQFLANQNADGYHADATSAGFVGGNHTLDQMGSNFKTAESVYVKYFADGVSVSSGYGRATKFEIRWANDVQAYNTVKQGGGGRACLREEHDMIFDGVVFNECVTLIPLEEITMSLWYGFQCVGIGSPYTYISFVDATNRQVFSSSDASVTSGNEATSGLIGWGDDHRIEMSVDITKDLGKRTYYTGTSGAFVSSSKGYFYIINQNMTMDADTTYYLDGSFRFLPTISEE